MPGIYFCGAAILTAIFVALWIVLPRRRPGALLAASALAPFGFLGYVFVPGYWRPDHLFQIVPGVGVEDFLICFSEGGLTWLLAGFGRRRFAHDAAASRAEASPRSQASIRAAMARFAIVACAGGALSVVGAALGLAIMSAIVIGFTIVGVAAAAARRDLVPGAVVAGSTFAALHATVGVLVLTRWPEATAFWNAAALTGIHTFGLPIEELAWALAFGACWPMFVDFAFFDVATLRRAAPGDGNAKSLSAAGEEAFEMRSKERRADRRTWTGSPGDLARKKTTFSSSCRPSRLPSFPSSSS